MTVTEISSSVPAGARAFAVSLSTPQDGEELAVDDDGFTEDIVFQVEGLLDEGDVEASVTVDKAQTP